VASSKKGPPGIASLEVATGKIESPHVSNKFEQYADDVVYVQGDPPSKDNEH
jgi:hypothetical protein